MLNFIPQPYRTYAEIAAVVLIFGAGFGSAWHLKTLGEEAAIAKAEAHAIQVTQAQDKITHDADVAAATAQQQIVTKIQTIIQKVPVHVTAKADAACSIPIGFLIVHNSAADLRAAANAAGQSDDSPSGIALSDVASTVAANYGTYHQVAQELTDLQAWLNAEQGLKR